MASIEALTNPAEPDTIPGVRLFAVLGVWMEADVVEATVKNAFVQGCERVYVVDNDSPDSTVETARAAGAIIARTFSTPRYDESLRLDQMNGVAAEVSAAEADEHIWWLFLDGDEFHHGPSGMTLSTYVRGLDRRFRVVGMRCFDHYPGSAPHYVQGRHPLDFQYLCDELAIPMCPAGHRKHPLLRWDKAGPGIRAGVGFHLVEGDVSLYEPTQPAFLHHFPYRDRSLTAARLQVLWRRDETGTARATETRDTHMLARVRSLDTVYGQDWGAVTNFLALDPMYSQLEAPPSPTGVSPKPWPDVVSPEHQHVLRWYSMVDAWNYGTLAKFNYGDDTTYVRGMSFLDGRGVIEDWGCGFARARDLVATGQYLGIDGSSQYADRIADLTTYTSKTNCIFMRHVLEHNAEWRQILTNALASFTDRMVLVVFTPFAETTRVIATTTSAMTSLPVPDISFRKTDLIELFGEIPFREESLTTKTQYGAECVFYLDKHAAGGSTNEVGRVPEAGLADLDLCSASTEDVLACRDRIVDAATEHFAQGRTQAGVQTLRLLAKATIDDNTLLRTDGFLPAIAAGRKVVATLDINRRPAADEVVIIYGNYPHMFGNVVVNNPIKRHVADFWIFRHDLVEYDRRWDGIGRIFIVNVDARRDRFDGVLRELASARAPFHLITRVSARPISPAALGDSGGQAACLGSHIDTLRQAQATGCRHVLVLEDDFCFSSDLESHLSDLRTFVERNYDYWVCLVATSKYGPIVPHDDLVSRSFQKCTNTGGYLISQAGLKEVLQVFEPALARMTATGDHVANAVDRCWAVLQPSEKFLVFSRKLGFQVSSFSDIERSISRYLD